MKKQKENNVSLSPNDTYKQFSESIRNLLEEARRYAARSINAILTTTYWEIGRRIVKYEQEGKERAEYGSTLLKRLSEDLTKRFGRGFSVDNIEQMRLFYLAYPQSSISETVSRKLGHNNIKVEKSEILSRILNPEDLKVCFPLTWSHYVNLIRRCKAHKKREFYESEALRCGWSIGQLNRQISSQF